MFSTNTLINKGNKAKLTVMFVTDYIPCYLLFITVIMTANTLIIRQ